MNCPKITPSQVAATINESSVRFLFIGRLELMKCFADEVDKISEGIISPSLRHASKIDNKIRGLETDIIILGKEPTEEELFTLEPALMNRGEGAIRPKGIYIAHIPEKPKTLEERVAELEQKLNGMIYAK